LDRPSGVRYISLFIEDDEHDDYDRYIAREIILDMSSYLGIIVRRMKKSDALAFDLLKHVLTERQVDRENRRKFQVPHLDWLELFVWEDQKLVNVEPVMALTFDRHAMRIRPR